MKPLNFIPLHLTVAFVFGLLSGYLWQLDRFYYLLPISLLICLVCLSYWIQYSSYHRSLSFTTYSILLFYFLGISAICEGKVKNLRNHYLNFSTETGKPSLLVLEITKTLNPNYKAQRYIAELQQVNQNQTSGKLLLNLTKKEGVKGLMIGEKILIKKPLYTIIPSKNPYQFNYKKYLEGQGVFNQVYLNQNEYLTLNSRSFSLTSWAQRFRIKVRSSLEKSGFNPTDVSMINALILGQRSGISQELRTNYTRAGAIHILAISGLHVGILLAILNVLLKPLDRFKKSRFIRLFISLVVLWAFAIIAGLSPSVVRAVTMFTAVALSLFGKRSSNLIQNLIISMFVLLLIRPKYLFEIGFQLSYLAVFAIILIQPILNRLWRPSWRLVNYFWQLLTVSFAAQIGVLPLSLYYFHQFPGLFFLSNLVIVPLLGCLLFTGILLIFLSLINSVPSVFVDFFGQLIELMNNFINWIANQESFVFLNIHFSIVQLLLSYVFLLCLVHWFHRKSRVSLTVVLASLLFLQSAFLYEKWKTQSTSEWVIFNIRKASLIAKKEGQNLHIFHSLENLKASEYLLNSYITGANTNTPIIKKGLPKTELFRNNLLLVDSLGIYPSKMAKNKSVLLVASPKINVDRLIEIVQPRQIIADRSNYKSYVDHWKRSCKKYKIPFHYTHQAGAWVSMD